MQISALSRRVLQTVFLLSSASTALTRPRLERRLVVASSELNPALDELTHLGLIDAQRLRLTLSGLAVAVASGARSSAKPRVVHTKTARLVAVQSPVSLFSQRETPRAVA